MSESDDTFQKLIGRKVVLDASSRFVYAGTLVGGNDRYVILKDVDVHDLRDSTTTREMYVLELKRYGVQANRKRVLVWHLAIVGISALDDVME